MHFFFCFLAYFRMYFQLSQYSIAKNEKKGASPFGPQTDANISVLFFSFFAFVCYGTQHRLFVCCWKCFKLFLHLYAAREGQFGWQREASTIIPDYQSACTSAGTRQHQALSSISVLMCASRLGSMRSACEDFWKLIFRLVELALCCTVLQSFWHSRCQIWMSCCLCCASRLIVVDMTIER